MRNNDGTCDRKQAEGMSRKKNRESGIKEHDGEVRRGRKRRRWRGKMRRET